MNFCLWFSSFLIDRRPLKQLRLVTLYILKCLLYTWTLSFFLTPYRFPCCPLAFCKTGPPKTNSQARGFFYCLTCPNPGKKVWTFWFPSSFKNAKSWKTYFWTSIWTCLHQRCLAWVPTSLMFSATCSAVNTQTACRIDRSRAPSIPESLPKLYKPLENLRNPQDLLENIRQPSKSGQKLRKTIVFPTKTSG